MWWHLIFIFLIIFLLQLSSFCVCVCTWACVCRGPCGAQRWVGGVGSLVQRGSWWQNLAPQSQETDAFTCWAIFGPLIFIVFWEFLMYQINLSQLCTFQRQLFLSFHISLFPLKCYFKYICLIDGCVCEKQGRIQFLEKWKVAGHSGPRL